MSYIGYKRKKCLINLKKLKLLNDEKGPIPFSHREKVICLAKSPFDTSGLHEINGIYTVESHIDTSYLDEINGINNVESPMDASDLDEMLQNLNS